MRLFHPRVAIAASTALSSSLVYSGGSGARTHLGLFVSSPRVRTWSRCSKMAARFAYTALCPPSSPRRPTHVATLHHPTPHPNRVLFELTTITGPFLACPPAGSPFLFARTSRVHVFTLHYDPCAHREDAAVDVPWEEWGPMGTHFSVLAMGASGSGELSGCGAAAQADVTRRLAGMCTGRVSCVLSCSRRAITRSKCWT